MSARDPSTVCKTTTAGDSRCGLLAPNLVFVFCCTFVWQSFSGAALLAQAVTGAGFAVERVRLGDDFQYGIALVVNDSKPVLSRGLLLARYRSSRDGVATVRAKMTVTRLFSGDGDDFQANAMGRADVSFVNGAIQRHVPTMVAVSSGAVHIALLVGDRFLVSSADIVAGGNDFHQGFRPTALIVGGVTGTNSDVTFAAAPGADDTEAVGRIAAVLAGERQTLVDGEVTEADFMVRGRRLAGVQLAGIAMVIDGNGEPCIGELYYAARLADGTAESTLAVPSCGVASDESYDAVDFQNMFLARYPRF